MIKIGDKFTIRVGTLGPSREWYLTEGKKYTITYIKKDKTRDIAIYFINDTGGIDCIYNFYTCIDLCSSFKCSWPTWLS